MTKQKEAQAGRVVWVERGIYARKTKAGVVRYGVSFWAGTRRVQEMVGPSITEARAVLAIRHSEVLRGKFGLAKKKPKPPTFDAFCERYLSQSKQLKKSWKRDELALKPMRVFFAPKRIDQVTTWDIERYRARRLESITKATCNRDLDVLRHMLNMAVEWEVIEKNPALKVKPHRLEQRAMRVLTLDEERALVKAAADHLKPLVTIAVNTGMRKGELLALEWDAVDTFHNIITVKHSKSGKVRHIPMSAIVAGTLKRIRGAHEGCVFKYGGKCAKNVKTAFASAVKTSGIRPCRFHDLRHTFATRLVLAGVDLPTVQRLLGHANISMTARYAHPSPEHIRAAVGRLALSVYGGKG